MEAVRVHKETEYAEDVSEKNMRERDELIKLIEMLDSQQMCYVISRLKEVLFEPTL